MVNPNSTEELLQLAEQGDLEAQYHLGICFSRGRGVEKNLDMAAHWFDAAAKKGHSGAQCSLGVCYLNGQGVKKDENKAVELFRLAAEQGDAHAQYCLGVCCYFGLGVESDESEMRRLFELARSQGHTSAYFALDEYARGVSPYGGKNSADNVVPEISFQDNLAHFQFRPGR